ncbi:hypothetical protein OF83DRAFT_1179014 [Amylostereum chailletii]|nr:hypothetical protein OF83DRAFT_1179014 [Amylostereum chailletii]
MMDCRVHVGTRIVFVSAWFSKLAGLNLALHARFPFLRPWTGEISVAFLIDNTSLKYYPQYPTAQQQGLVDAAVFAFMTHFHLLTDMQLGGMPVELKI